MERKNALYAAVGAPVAVAKTINARLETLRSELESRTEDLTEAAQRRLDEWAEEGRQVVTKVTDGKMVDELTAKVDFDQAREQVTKLRDQLEDMLATWRTSFRPEDENAAGSPSVEEKTDQGEGAEAKASTISASKSSGTKKAPAKQPAAKQGTKASAGEKSTKAS